MLGLPLALWYFIGIRPAVAADTLTTCHACTGARSTTCMMCNGSGTAEPKARTPITWLS